MAIVGRVYNGDQKIAESESPIELIQLEPETAYNLTLTKYDTVYDLESQAVEVPEFTTLAVPEFPVIATSMTVLPESRTCAVGDWRNFVVDFKPEDTTDKGITWEVDETALQYIPNPNDTYLRFKALKVGSFPVKVTSTSNPELTKTVTFNVTE